MRQVVLGNWKHGFNKVGMNRLLRGRSGLTLSEAKAVVDRVLRGEEVTVEVDDETVGEFIEAAKESGMEARAIDDVAADDPRSTART